MKTSIRRKIVRKIQRQVGASPTGNLDADTLDRIRLALDVTAKFFHQLGITDKKP